MSEPVVNAGIAFDECIFYFRCVPRTSGAGIKENYPTFILDLAEHTGEFYSLAVRPTNRSLADLILHQLTLELEKRSGWKFYKYYDFSIDEHVKPDKVERGIAITTEDLDGDFDMKVLSEAMVKYGLTHFCRYYLSSGILMREVRRLCTDGGVNSIIEQKDIIRPVSPPQFHPAFRDTSDCAVFTSLPDVLNVLHECAGSCNGPVQQLLRIAAEHGIGVTGEAEQSSAVSANNTKCPLIVVEGLDGTGKTTLTKTLADKVNGSLKTTPPPSLVDLRPWFDSQPSILRRAYYCLGNYVVAKEIATQFVSGTVVMDRFWHSTAAYAIATASGPGDISNLPPIGHWVYQWPLDLLKPDIVFVLTLSEEARAKRINQRSGIETEEEKKIAANIIFREKLTQAYMRMSNPAMVQIDAGLPPDGVVESVMKNLNDLHII